MVRWVLGSAPRGKASRLAGLFCVALAVGTAALRGMTFASLPDPLDADVSLSDVERAVAAIHPVPEISGAEAELLLDRQEAVLFDIRERREFETSHLRGAIHVDPNQTAEGFVAKYGDRLKGRIAIFYCAVGLRSAVMLERTAPAIAAYRPAAVYNLRGGVFRWFAEGRVIVNETGRAAAIDPYSGAWEALLQRTMGARS